MCSAKRTDYDVAVASSRHLRSELLQSPLVAMLDKRTIIAAASHDDAREAKYSRGLINMLGIIHFEDFDDDAREEANYYCSCLSLRCLRSELLQSPLITMLEKRKHRSRVIKMVIFCVELFVSSIIPPPLTPDPVRLVQKGFQKACLLVLPGGVISRSFCHAV